jgi:membrane-associated phospholipid phosphatase
MIKKLIPFSFFLIPFAANASFWGPLDTGLGRTTGTIERIGDWGQLLIPISAAVYSTAISDWEGLKQLTYSTGATFATTEILKNTIREERPFQDEDAKGTTFPSGHTSFAFAGAGYWQMRYGWEIGAPMYAAAAFVGYSRVRSRWHNWTDVGVGAAIGIGFNYLFTSRYNDDRTQVSLSPTNGGAYLGASTKF